jgi:chaperonin GroEL (HSP60 family)
MHCVSFGVLSRNGTQTLTPIDDVLIAFRQSALIGGGGAPEIHVSRLLSQYSQSLKGMQAYCFQAYADALEVIPTTLAENAGLNPIAIVTELRNRHALGERNAGINVRKVCNPMISVLVLHTDGCAPRDSYPIYWRRMSCSHC